MLLKQQKKDYKLNLIQHVIKMSTAKERIALNLNAVKEQTLKSVNVNLAISDDLKGASSALNSANSDLLKAISNYEAQYKVLRQAMSSAQSVQSAQAKVITIADAKSKELGVTPNSVGGYGDAEKAYLLIDKTLGKANEY